jgi:phospholipase A2
LKADYFNLKKYLYTAGAKTKDFGLKAKNFSSGIDSAALNNIVGSSAAQRSLLKDSSYDHSHVINIRFANALSKGEHEYLVKRKPKIRAALEEIYDQNFDEQNLPIISIVASGGGYRAMLGTIGFLCGIEKIGLLDAITYVAALSGSTWAVAPWIVTGMSLPEFKKYIALVITRDLNDVSYRESRLMDDMLRKKFLGLNPMTVVDVYGGLLANRLLNFFGDHRQLVYLSDLAEHIKNGDYVYPIFTAIDARSGVAFDAPWFEFTPHEIGSAEFGIYIPTQAYGRRFNAGKSISLAPEVSLGFHLGTFGSAFGVHMRYAWSEIESTISESWFKKMMTNLVEQYEGKRFFWANVNNFMFGLFFEGNAFEKRRFLKLVDAGLAFNLPYPPVSGERPERKPDVLIFCDMSAAGGEHALRKCEAYARKRNLPFPRVNYKGITKRTITIFKDDTNSAVPVVIYMPSLSDHDLWEKNKLNPQCSAYGSIDNFDIDQCVKNGFCKTTNFQYTRHQSQQVMDQMEFNVVANKEKIIDAIGWVVEKKLKRRPGNSRPSL